VSHPHPGAEHRAAATRAQPPALLEADGCALEPARTWPAHPAADFPAAYSSPRLPCLAPRVVSSSASDNPPKASAESKASAGAGIGIIPAGAAAKGSDSKGSDSRASSSPACSRASAMEFYAGSADHPARPAHEGAGGGVAGSEHGTQTQWFEFEFEHELLEKAPVTVRERERGQV
jgi:hypothetical protein